MKDTVLLRVLKQALPYLRQHRHQIMVIKLGGEVAGNVDENAWHKTQQTMFESDGSLIFEVDVDGIEEISWWVLGYGDQAQVIDPPELRKMIADRVAGMHRHYSGGNGDTGSA